MPSFSDHFWPILCGHFFKMIKTCCLFQYLLFKHHLNILYTLKCPPVTHCPWQTCFCITQIQCFALFWIIWSSDNKPSTRRWWDTYDTEMDSCNGSVKLSHASTTLISPWVNHLTSSRFTGAAQWPTVEDWVSTRSSTMKPMFNNSINKKQESAFKLPLWNKEDFNLKTIVFSIKCNLPFPREEDKHILNVKWKTAH